MYTPHFVAALLSQVSVGPDTKPSALFYLAKNNGSSNKKNKAIGTKILRSLLNNLTKKELLNKPEFLTRLFEQVSNGPDAKTSALYWLLRSEMGIAILARQLTIGTERFQKKIASNPCFLDALLAQPSSSSATKGHTGLYSLIEDERGCEILQNLLADKVFKQKLLTHPDFMPALLEKIQVEPDRNSSAFHQLSLTKKGIEILLDLLTDIPFETFPPDTLTHFINTLLLTPQNYTMRASTLYNLVSVDPEKGIKLLRNMLTSVLFKSSLLAQPDFINALLSQINKIGPYYPPVLWCLITSPEGIELLTLLLADETFKRNFTLHSDFLISLLTRRPAKQLNAKYTSGLTNLAEYPVGIQLLQNLLASEAFKTKLIFHPGFIPALISRTFVNQSTTFELMPWLDFLVNGPEGLEIFRGLLTNDKFKTQLFSHPEFLPSLLVQHPTGLQGVERSAFASLAANPVGVEIAHIMLKDVSFVRSCITNKEFVKLITFHPQILTLFCRAVLIEFPRVAPIGPPTSLFCELLETPKGYQIVKHLMDNPLAKTAVLNHLGLSRQEPSLYWLFASESGFLLFTSLLRHHQQYLLLASDLTPQTLFQHPRVSLLIRMGQINPDLFLFIAATGPSDEAFISCLANPIFSPWATTAKGRSLLDVINTSSLDEDTKTRRKQYLSDAFQRYSSQISDGNFVVHLNRLGSLHTQPPDGASPPQLPEAVVPSYQIDGVSVTDTQSFIQHIQWILNQPVFRAYHDAFVALASNQTIRNPIDYSEVLSQLKTLCAWMNHYVLNGLPIPEPYPEWTESFALCDDGVLNTFGEMFNEFSNQPALATYLQQVQSDTSSRYNRLFFTPSNLEVHVPKSAIQAEMGLSSALPRFDVFMRSWNRIQRRWVAQTAMEPLINPDPLIESLIGPLEIVGPTIAPEVLLEKYPAYRRSPLFAKPFNLRNFYAFIADMPEDDERLETSVPLRRDLSKALKIKANAFLVDHQIVTEPKIVHMFNELLWQFLTRVDIGTMTPAERRIYHNLLIKCATAVDGLAFIKFCIQSHQGEVGRININNVLYSFDDNYSIFSLLIANPFYAEWLFGFKMVMTQIEEKPHIRFEAEASGLSDLAKALLGSEKTTLELESILHQPGTLFFWLYYFQGDPARKELFQAILSFLLASPKRLYAYDTLAPLLYDMQKSPMVSNLDKVLVQTFLQARLDVQSTILQTQSDESVKMKDDTFWLTACTLTTPNIGTRIMPMIRTNSELLKTLGNPKNWNAFCYLVNGDPDMIFEAMTLEALVTTTMDVEQLSPLESNVSGMAVDNPDRFFQPQREKNRQESDMCEDDSERNKRPRRIQ